ncbi:MAG: M28 family peptidase [Gemmatimonadota bacterium]|nr:M28 family peptidase [Gemmatimonadota bacterium]
MKRTQTGLATPDLGPASRLRRALPAVLAALALVLAAGCGDDATGPGDTDRLSFEAAAASITEADVASHVEALAHDSARGRWSPSPELDRAAAWIADAFASWGLRPGGDDGFYQVFEVSNLVKNRPGGAGPVRNVIGWIRGSDPALRDEAIVYTAHYDHLGWAVNEGQLDGTGDEIFNGADDNASGTAGLLEIAQAFAAATPPRRSVVFVATAGEERGLLGAHHYALNPLFPLDRTVGNLNLDMIGRNDPNRVDLIHSAGSALADSALAIAARRPGIGLTPTDVVDGPLGGRSDHFAFQVRGVDALFFHTGLHEDYHTLQDEADRLDAAKAAAVARLAFWTGVSLVD